MKKGTPEVVVDGLFAARQPKDQRYRMSGGMSLPSAVVDWLVNHG